MNYIGSKQSLADFILYSIWDTAGTDTNKIFCDLFAGTGAVGKLFRANGYDVISNDIQYYSYVLNRHFIENSTPIGVPLDVSFCLDKIFSTDGFIYNHYCPGSGSGRLYFTDHNGQRCDGIRSMLEVFRRGKDITEDAYYWLLATLINSMDKRANTASVYGAFLKHFKKSALEELKLEMLPVIDGKKGVVYNKRAEDLITEIKGDILYLDPPYNSRQYCAYYHILETIALNDNPEIHGKTGLRNHSGQTSDFCSVKTAAKALEYIIANADFPYVFLSYNNEGIIPFDVIKSIMSKYGHYELFSTEYNRFKADSNREYKSNKTIEYLHCCIR